MIRAEGSQFDWGWFAPSRYLLIYYINVWSKYREKYSSPIRRIFMRLMKFQVIFLVEKKPSRLATCPISLRMPWWRPSYVSLRHGMRFPIFQQSLLFVFRGVVWMLIPGTPNNQFKMDVWWFPTISYVKNWNHPTETTTNKWMALGFQVFPMGNKKERFSFPVFMVELTSKSPISICANC